jgi:hypothetical protein
VGPCSFGSRFLASCTKTKVDTLSTESLATSTQANPGSDRRCAACGAPLAGDQRYCLECGERTTPMSSVLLSPAPAREHTSLSIPPIVPPFPPRGSRADAGAPRSNTLNVLAGVGVLLLAMGVGVLIGRSNSPKQIAAPAQVITVGSVPSTGTSAAGASEATFAGDWPAGTSGYTVQLQTLPEAGTSFSTVEGAKAAATAKGAKATGALKSEEFGSLSAGSYVIYSGIYQQRSEAQKALAGLKKSFPGAKVIHVSNASHGSASSNESGGSSKSGVGSSESHPAPPSVLKKLKGTKGKSYEEQSKALPDVVETG